MNNEVKKNKNIFKEFLTNFWLRTFSLIAVGFLLFGTFGFNSNISILDVKAQEEVILEARSGKVEYNDVNIYYFYGNGCPHCAVAGPFLEELAENRDNVTLHKYEVWYNSKNQDLFKKVAENLETTPSGVPFTIIGKEYVVGFGSIETTGETVEKKVDFYSSNNYEDSVHSIVGLEKEPETKKIEGSTIISKPVEGEDGGEICDNGEICKEEDPASTDRKDLEKVEVDILGLKLGTVDLSHMSLPVLSIVIGFLDGFNPCAMWVLVFLISILFEVEQKWKRWVLGGIFIAGSGVVYFGFLAAWFGTFEILGYVPWIQAIVALIALGFGIYSLYDYKQNPNAVCQVSSNDNHKKVFDKIKNVIKNPNFILSAIGILILSFTINFVELVCSAALPATYTSILSSAELPLWLNFSYIGLYVLFFLIDDIIVFAIAMTTMEITGISTKYSRFSKLAGGILMILIGIWLAVQVLSGFLG